MTEILLRPAEQIPEVFVERLQGRENGERALVTSMTVDFVNNPVVEAMIQHGVPDDIFAIDYRGHEHGFAPIVTKTQGHHEARAKFEEDFPGQYVVLGEPEDVGTLRGSLINRSHIKAKAVGKRILSLGDVNCAPYCFDSTIGLMIDFESEEFMTFLSEFVKSQGNLRGRDRAGESILLTDQSEILIDYGKKGESVILDHLLQDLERDELVSAKISSSYIPYGQLDALLYSHFKAGKNVTFYSNHPSKFHPPFHSRAEKWMQVLNSLKAQTQWIDNRPDKFNHLKAAVFVYDNGNKIAYAASSTFHPLPIWAGTAEVALRTKDPFLVDEIESFMVDSLDKTKV